MGHAYQTTDNLGRINETQFDAASRAVRTIQNYDGLDYGVPGSGFDGYGVPLETSTEQDITVDYEYDSAGRLATMIAYNAKDSGNGVEQQATAYLYTSPINGSWQTAAVYPDSVDGLEQDGDSKIWFITDDRGDHVSTAYDRLGRVHSTTDQRGVTHEFLYDTAGRLKGDVVDLSGELPDQNVDDTITAIGTTYDDLGRVEFVSSLCGADANEDGLPDDVVNQVKEEYNGWSRVAREYQAHDGVVDTGANGTPFVQYDYDDSYAAPSETSRPAKYVRLQSVTYPSADRVVEHGYGDAQSTDINKVIDAVMSRLETIGNASEIDAAYTYLGAGTIVEEDYVSAQTRLSYLDPTARSPASTDSAASPIKSGNNTMKMAT